MLEPKSHHLVFDNQRSNGQRIAVLVVFDNCGLPQLFASRGLYREQLGVKRAAPRLEHYQSNRLPAIDKISARKSDVFSRECGGAS